MRIAVVTSVTAEPVIRELVRASKAVESRRVEARVVALPTPVIGVLTAEGLLQLAARNASRLLGFNVILIPGTVEGDVSRLAELTGARVYKASRDPGLLPRIIDYVAEGGVLDPVKPVEEVLSIEVPGIEAREIAYEVGGVKVPLRGPPLVLVAEVSPDVGDEHAATMAERMEAEGAEIIVVGASRRTGDVGRRVSRIVDAVGAPVVSEAPTPSMARLAVEAGAAGVTISAGDAAKYMEALPRGSLVILGERDVSALERSVELYRRAGYEKIAADPVVGLPLIDYSRTPERYARAEVLRVPLLFSGGNAATVLDADSHGVYAILAAMAVELSASLFLVVEDTYKTIHAAAEAREALRLAYRAWSRRIQPHGLGSRLLVLKQLEPPPRATIPFEGSRVVEGPVEPVMDRGYFRIEVDHERHMIMVECRVGRERRVYAGATARYLARVIARETGITPEHAAYLGEELAKAELALRLGKTYIQDSDLLRPVWEP